MTHPRVKTLLQIVSDAGVDAIALIPGPNLHYITGQDFHLSERPLVVFFVPGREPVAVVPSLEEDRLKGTGIPFKTFPWADAEGPSKAFAAAAAELKLKNGRIGVEELRMRVLEVETLRSTISGVQVVPAGVSLQRLRLCKDSVEIATMREAIAISEAALTATLKTVEPGQMEREVLSTLVIEQLKRAGGKHPFEPIVLAGPKSALPHGEPAEWRVKKGAPLLIDFGTTVRGYASDITRTFSVGEPSAQFKKVYALVKAANEAGRAAARPGVTAQDVDRATRKVIEDAGYGSYFTHRTGHGLGLDVHEDPNIVEGNTLVLEPGMVFTIEPGIYIPGEFGVRIEDNVVITDDGAESLTTFPRELQAIGV